MRTQLFMNKKIEELKILFAGSIKRGIALGRFYIVCKNNSFIIGTNLR